MRLLTWLARPKPRTPDGEVIYAIGDIHGRADLLALLHGAIEADLAERLGDRRATVVYLGDYIDRGPDSKAVIDRLLDDPVRNAESVFLKGNHEDAMLRFLDGEKGGEAWLAIGGGATARSYGAALRPANGDTPAAAFIRSSLLQAIPGRHMSFLRNLRLTYESGDYLFVHAGVRPGVALDEQDPRDLLWIRRGFLNSRRDHGKFIVHGHSSARRIAVKRNRMCVDTMAYATDRLSCVVLDGASRRFLSAER